VPKGRSVKFILEIRKKDIKKLEAYFEHVDVEAKGIDAIKECFWLPDNRSIPGEIDLRDSIKIVQIGILRRSKGKERKSVLRKRVKQTPEKELAKVLKRWVQNHRTPDKPLLVIGRHSYSPKQIVQEIRDGTPIGKELKIKWSMLNKKRNGVK